MAQLTFEKTINLTASAKNPSPKYVDSLMICQEPTDEMYQYFLSGAQLLDKKSYVDGIDENPDHYETYEAYQTAMLQKYYADYEALSWKDPTSSITAKTCSNFGVKTFPTIGAIGFYTPLVGNSKFLVPIHLRPAAKYKAPTLAMTSSGNNLVFTITPPEDIVYSCYRIVMQYMTYAIEYITYETTLTVPIPTVKARYFIHAVGYVGEGTYTSESSNVITYTVSTGSSTPKPITPAYATKEYVDQLIGQINSLLDQINGEVV